VALLEPLKASLYKRDASSCLWANARLKKRLSRCAEELVALCPLGYEQLKAPPEVEVDSHPLWGWESKEASLSLRISPPKGGKEGLITCYLR